MSFKLDSFIYNKHTDIKIENVRKAQLQQKKEIVLISSIEPKQGHLLYEFIYENGYFKVFETHWKMIPELVLIWDGNKMVKKEAEKTELDILNPVPIKKKSNLIKYNPNAGYVTALNYTNAIRKFKQLNPQYFN